MSPSDSETVVLDVGPADLPAGSRAVAGSTVIVVLAGLALTSAA